LDDCDDAEFLKFINERPNLSEAFVGHKNSWTHTDFENIAEKKHKNGLTEVQI